MPAFSPNGSPNPIKRGRGRPPLPIVLHPEPQWPDDQDPQDFAEALVGQMKRHQAASFSVCSVLSSRTAVRPVMASQRPMAMST